ncbi:MAG TPA: aminodeoxychorismate synthase, component I, partial [Lysobacter sp.]|nr:aminodeoxychorismate synthase, component I [Lysobacter sp.]
MIVTRALPGGPDLLALHRLHPARYPVLLESSAHGTAQGRWDLLLVASGELLRRDRDGVTRDGSGRALGTGFLQALDDAWRASRIPREASRWPFRGGWALLLAYELAGEVEPVLRLPGAPGAVPVALALRCPAAVLRDRVSGECVAVAETEHAAWLEAIVADAARVGEATRLPWRSPDELHEDAPER